MTPASVALMNNTISQIYEDKESVWKFHRTEIWLRFFQPFSEQSPPPLNIIYFFLNLRTKSHLKASPQKKRAKLE